MNDYTIKSVTALAEQGNNRATVVLLGPDGSEATARIVKQAGMRAYLVMPDGIKLTHRQKRHLQREAVTAWANQISGDLDGLLECERVYRGSRIPRLHVQLSVYCPVCDRRTPSDHSTTPAGLIRNACAFCGSMRKGKPFVSQAEFDRITERLQTLASNACKGTRRSDEYFMG